MFHTVVHCHKLGKVENECMSGKFGMSVPKIIQFSGNLTKLRQKQFWRFFSEIQCRYSAPAFQCAHCLV